MRDIGHRLTNGTDGGEGGDTGRLRTDEERELMSAFHRGRKKSNAHRKAIAVARTGMRFTDEHKSNLSIAHKGYKPTPEARSNQSEAQRGREVSDDTRKKLRLAWTEERKAALSSRMAGNTNTLGVKATEETRALLREARNRFYANRSPEDKEKKAAALRAAWIRRKARI